MGVTYTFTELFGRSVEISPDNTNGLQAIERLPDGSFAGGADPRREGLILGN